MILEYAILLGVIVAVIIAIQVYVKRAVEGRMKSSADSIGDQFTTQVDHTVQTIRQSARKEETLTGMDVGAGEWSKSEIAVGADQNWATGLGDYTAIADDYREAEVTVTDFVDANEGGQAVGGHDVLDLGVQSDQTIYEDIE